MALAASPSAFLPSVLYARVVFFLMSGLHLHIWAPLRQGRSWTSILVEPWMWAVLSQPCFLVPTAPSETVSWAGTSGRDKSKVIFVPPGKIWEMYCGGYSLHSGVWASSYPCLLVTDVPTDLWTGDVLADLSSQNHNLFPMLVAIGT